MTKYYFYKKFSASLPYRTSKAIALHIRRGCWHVYPLDGFDPVKQTFDEFCSVRIPTITVNRRNAIAHVKTYG